MKTYDIPVVWQMTGTMSIKAHSLKEAEEKALTEAPLPDDSTYLECSCEVDKESELYISHVEREEVNKC